jgi:hypothetical protein
MLTDTSRSPYAKLQSLPVGSVTWTDGFWAAKERVCNETMVPNMRRLLADDELSHNLANFQIAAGQGDGSHTGPPFGDGDLYKWLEAAVFSFASTHDEELGREIDDTIGLIAKVQREDGYIFTKQAIENRNNPGSSEALSDHLNFEVYNLGHLMTAACAHVRATGKRSLLEIAEKAAGYLETTFAELSPENAKTAVCPSHYMGLVELYRTTGQRRYLTLAKRLIEMRDLVREGTDDNQDRIPLAEQRKAVGHAVRANYLYAGVADLYAETGNPEFLEVLESCWENVVYQKMYITGSCGALYDGVSPYGSSDYDEIQRTHQAYGREYELPNVTGYNETCAAIGNVLWNWRMLNLSGESRFADIIELVMHNGGLAGISLDGKNFFYSNALRRHRKLPFSLKWSRERQPYISSFCCPPNLVRTIAESASYAYAVSRESVFVLLYGANQAKIRLESGAEFSLSQSSDYPWDGKIRIRIEEALEPVHFALNLRIPRWAESAEVYLNGERMQLEVKPGMFLPIDREWCANDELVLLLPMNVNLMEANPLVEEDRNQVAVQRGPIVYCLETADLPAGSDISEFFLPDEPDWKEDLSYTIGAERMLTLKTTLLRRRERAWPSMSFRPRERVKMESVEARLIPYYAWDNRGFGEMSVWLPLWGGQQ